ncbi:glutathione S-transferase family protein [Shimia sp. R9_1]|uniref:glutathione S-transferase family protein n=1 Tax=Shimia sp. R9_1 TaxID=2821111 RepID=UPI001ADAE868|nr:glutathione S-transferase family protein [Shimia sp. R9_1]MBO9408924.1 glutathione S-transferase family protein [Shimia sp. R9_1]
MTETFRLHYAPDNASLIIRLALEELGLSYETLLVDRRNKAQFSPAYLALNPNGTIPVLETSDGVLFETAAILMWLSETTEKLAPPPGSPLRAPFLKWMFWCSNTFQIDLRHFFYPEKFIGDDPEHQAQLRKIFRQRLEQDLQILEDGLTQTSDLAGAETATLLDIYVPCLLRWTKLYADLPDHRWFDINRYPTLLRICTRAEARASTHAAQIAEGLGPTPFTNPALAAPPEGSAT